MCHINIVRSVYKIKLFKIEILQDNTLYDALTPQY